MTAEFAGVPQFTEIVALKEIEAKKDSPNREELIGKRALNLEGFAVLGAIESPYIQTRRKLESRIIDQGDAINAIFDAVDRVDMRLPDDHRPMASFAFLGPTGTGKTETAKSMSELMTRSGGSLVKIDCSDYSSGHEITRLVGSPPSYVGHDQEAVLSKDKVEKAGTIVLFDEIEKGSTALYNLMLQIMDYGKLQLNNGDVVSFRGTMVIMTSNLGAEEISAQLSSAPLGFGEKNKPKDKEALERVARKSFVDFFKPEFVNRINKIVVFQPLSVSGLGRVLDVKLAGANNHYEKEYGVRLSLSEQTRSQLVDIAASEPHLGARPLVRALEDNIQTTFGRYNKSGMLPEGTHVRVIHSTEIEENGIEAFDSPFIFTSKLDTSIRKQPKPIALPAPEQKSSEQESTEEEAEE